MTKKKITFNRNQYFLETITHPWFKQCEELEGAIISNTAKNIPLNQKRKHGQPYKAKNGLSRYFLETQPITQANIENTENTT